MSGTVTDLDLTRLEELAGKATPGPWFIDELDRIYVGNRADGRDCGLWEIVYATDDKLGDLTPRAQERERADAAFIAEFRNAVPSLLAAARALAELVRLKDGPRDDAYRAAKEAAWSAARAALGTGQEGHTE